MGAFFFAHNDAQRINIFDVLSEVNTSMKMDIILYLAGLGNYLSELCLGRV